MHIYILTYLHTCMHKKRSLLAPSHPPVQMLACGGAPSPKAPNNRDPRFRGKETSLKGSNKSRFLVKTDGKTTFVCFFLFLIVRKQQEKQNKKCRRLGFWFASPKKKKSALTLDTVEVFWMAAAYEMPALPR